MNNVVINPYEYFADPTKGRPIFNGSVYIGQPDTDPEVPANQKQVYARQEDGNDVAIPQPVLTNAGGYPTYNGSVIAIVVDGPHSLKVNNKDGSQLLYSSNSYNGIATTDDYGSVLLATDAQALAGTAGVIPDAEQVRKNHVAQVATITDLRALEPAFDGQQVSVGQDTLAGIFKHIASNSGADDGADTIVTSSGKRWVRLQDKLLTDLSSYGGAGAVGFDDDFNFQPNTVGEALRNATRGTIYVESFRTPGLSDSNTIRAALNYIEINRDGLVSELVFEAARTYIYDRSGELRTINNLIINLNGAILRRAPATATRALLAQDVGTGQSSIYVDAIPDNWEVGDYLAAYSGPSDAQTSKNVCRITNIIHAENRVTLSGGLGSFGLYTTIIPAGTTVAKKFGAFVGRPSSTEAGIPTTGGVNYNVHIINGVIDGNKANQENNSWYFNAEIMLHGRQSSVSGITFERTAGECIVGHGLRVANNSFRSLNGSAFHTSMHDDSWASASASWFVNNFVDGVCLATQEVGGHTEGAVTFSWGAGRLIITGNEFANGTESVLGSFYPEATNTDRWLIFSNNLCRNFDRLFYDIGAGVEGVVVTDNILIDCESAQYQMQNLYSGRTNIVGGNSCIGNTQIAGVYRAPNAVFGDVSSTITKLATVSGSPVPAFDIVRLSGDRAAVMDPATATVGMVCGDSGYSGHSFHSPSGSPAGEFFAIWRADEKVYDLQGNVNGGIARVRVKNAILNFNYIQTYADNASAIAGGLLAGDVYVTPAGQLMRAY